MGKDFERLPKSLKPVHYTLDLTPNLVDFKIKGEQTVELEVKETTSTIKFNVVDIELCSATVNGTAVDLSSALQKDPENEACTISLATPLEAGSKASLQLSFTSELNDKLKGFYRSNYIKDGEKKWCGVTQFESTDARRCFPCWDEPAVKSTFTCSLSVPKGILALSNMPVTSETENGDLVKVQFDKSPIMSTYLLAFYVGESEYVSAKTNKGVEVRVYTPLGKKSHGEFALHMGVKCLEYYEDYFQVTYPLPKCDQIGLDDFSAGAMENWGLVTYRSNLLLVDPANSSTSTKQRVAIVVAHELAHQWFGNLVTMEWWTHLWLNEGFASFMEYLATDHVHPDYAIFDHFVKDDFTRGMELDALDSSHPIEVAVNHPSEVDEIFDHISYCKGSSVIRMLHSWIGNDAFRSGMKDYLDAFKYQNTLTEDLWAKLKKASSQPVDEVMSTWTSQMGFPLITAKMISETEIEVSQQKFSANGPSDSDQMWQIPIEVCSADSPTAAVQKTVLKERTGVIKMDKPSKWFKLNCGSCGFYRVRYDSAMFESFDVSQMLTRDRLQLQGDTFALATAGYIGITDYLNLLNLYKNETDYTVLASILEKLSDINKVCWNLDDTTRAGFRAWRPRFLAKAMEKVGFEKKAGEGHGDSLLRASLISVLGKLGDEKVYSWCKDAFEKHTQKENPVLIAGDLRSAVFGAMAAQATDAAVIDQLITLWEQNAESQEEQSNVEGAIAAVKAPENITKVAAFIKDRIKLCNKPFTYVGLCNSSLTGCDAVWAYVSGNIEEVRSDFSGFLRQAIVARTFQAYGTTVKHDEMKAFFEANPIQGAERAIPQMLEKVASRAAMLERSKESLQSYNWSG